jgi:hypothetical protein
VQAWAHYPILDPVCYNRHLHSLTVRFFTPPRAGSDPTDYVSGLYVVNIVIQGVGSCACTCIWMFEYFLDFRLHMYISMSSPKHCRTSDLLNEHTDHKPGGTNVVLREG